MFSSTFRQGQNRLSQICHKIFCCFTSKPKKFFFWLVAFKKNALFVLCFGCVWLRYTPPRVYYWCDFSVHFWTANLEKRLSATWKKSLPYREDLVVNLFFMLFAIDLINASWHPWISIKENPHIRLTDLVTANPINSIINFIYRPRLQALVFARLLFCSDKFKAVRPIAWAHI